jgi:uncharacterized protein
MAIALAREWRLRAERYQLAGGHCAACGAYQFPRRPKCLECGSADIEPYRFRGEGEVFSHATMYKAPTGFEQDIPYVVALVKLVEGPLVTAQITDVEPADVQIGMAVEAVLRKWRQYEADGPLVYGYKFRPRLAE